MALGLTAVPARPGSAECDKAYSILGSARTAANSFLHAYQTSRQGTRGTSTDEQQDLLRAMLIFSCAGLDSLIKQLIRDALPVVVNREKGADVKFREFVHSKTSRGDGVSEKLIANVLASREPRKELIELLVRDLTGDSLQSAEQIFKVAAFFDIPTRDICSSIDGLKAVFVVRNQIGHEMDIAFDQPNRSRRPRSQGDMVKHTNTVFDLSDKFLAAVHLRVTRAP